MPKIFRYYGSKTYLLPDIKKVIKPIEDKITCFVDVFGGSGVVVLNITETPTQNQPALSKFIDKNEDKIDVIKIKKWRMKACGMNEWQLVYNDIDKSLYKTFIAVQDDAKRARLLEKLEYAFHDRAIFEEYKQRYKDGNMPEDDVECAFMIIYLYQNSFSGDISSFGINIDDPSCKPDRTRASIDGIKELYFKLRSRITVENLDWKDIIEKWDSETTLFYLDPPYLTGGRGYRFGAITIDTYKEMKNIIDSIHGYYLMNESDKDFNDLIPIFGEPQLKVKYVNHIAHGSYRTEGFWWNFDKAIKPKRNKDI